MIWIDNIYQLQYYNQPKGAPCYCEMIIFPADMQLQGQVFNGNGSYTLKLYVFSADGLTQYEDATSYFDHYFGVIPGTGVHFFNAKLKSFSPAMCSHACFIMKAVVTSGSTMLFSKYTERYCISNCCDVARGISFSQTSITHGPIVVGGTGGGTVIPIEPSAPVIPTDDCGEPLIRLITKFDCIDSFTGDFYGIPGNVLSGTASFSFVKITNMKGRIVRRPRDIKREISFNCRLQRAESTGQYLLEGFEYFPAWKMYEIEGQLHANHIRVDDFITNREYQYSGDTPFRQIHNCTEVFKLETMLEDCTQRQVFGCGVNCDEANYDGSSSLFVIPESYEGGSFYNESGLLIAEDYDGLLVWFRGQQGVTGVQDIDTEDLPCVIHKVFSIHADGYVPRSIYMDNTRAANRLYSKRATIMDDICNGITSGCAKPVAGTIEIENLVCAEPVTGTIIVSTITATEIPMTGYGNWEMDDTVSIATVYHNEVSLSIKLTNEILAPDPSYPDVFPIVSNEVIAIIGSAGRPENPVVLNHSNNGNIPEGFTLILDPGGFIKAIGTVTGADSSGSTIELNNLYYTI